MNKITVLRLSGCGHCEDLIEGLDSRGIVYKSIDANKHGDLADAVEDLLKVYIYPIVIIENNSLSLPKTYLYRADDMDSLGEKVIEGSRKIGFFSVEDMIKGIVNNLK